MKINECYSSKNKDNTDKEIEYKDKLNKALLASEKQYWRITSNNSVTRVF